MTPVYWIGVLLASGLPDLDLLLGRFGLAGPRYHRNGSHSFLLLGGLVAGTFLLQASLFAASSRGLLMCWGVALFSHPLLDIVTTGPDLAARGYGIALLWPFSRRRFFVRRPVVRTPELERCEGMWQLVSAIGPEVLILGPPTILVLLVALIS
jgi:membrane-bound metal-dependent hydrolase YbcI (DUF457 family)